MPEERHLLEQRPGRLADPPQPPSPQRIGRTGGRFVLVLAGVEAVQSFRTGHQLVDRLLGACAKGLLQLTPGAAKRGAAVQMTRPFESPRSIRIRKIGSPGPARIGRPTLNWFLFQSFSGLGLGLTSRRLGLVLSSVTFG